MDDLRLFAITWNTQTVRYDTEGGPCADFVDELSAKIIESSRDYHLVLVALQEDSIKDSPLLDSKNLIKTALDPKYKLLDTVQLSGWGLTTYKALKEDWDYRPRGLRLALFARRDWIENIDYQIIKSHHICPGIRNWLTFGKGGVVITLKLPNLNLTFLNMHLPFYSQSVYINKDLFIQERHRAMLWQAKCLQDVYTETVNLHAPDYLFLLGDLNFRIQLRKELSALEIAQNMLEDPTYLRELIKEGDELGLLSSYSKIPEFKEGVGNQGPTFLPTAKLRTGRDGVKYKLGKEHQRIPSWCDRILYRDFNKSEYTLSCALYERWEYGNMNLSDHCSVIGVYNLCKHGV